MHGDSKDDLVKTTVRQLMRVAHRVARVEDLPIRVHDDLEITTKEAHTIEAVGERPGLSVTDVATTFGITKSAASQMVTKLVAKGFLTKVRAPHSNKEWELGLTPLGWTAFRAHESAHGRDFARLVDHLNSFSLSQIATLTVLLEAIGGIMEDRLGE
ncbi:MarR family winged helix-turn-helix transcriptional regulator [Roseospira visakhapatnamensis]|uniref:DNA-binding MarR family transcriptional regulator n=1 Tax=Roseospira visakhapatnamensis TaxID=390880 RepID=A0A7W6REH9_9PROT|nr:MarR family winged helix-turn-helix transcriptional regulator [Roseospira visakhapatnamensis]MBB4267008.1 DNA-binding MarR family transcriptional regulator [Roseospira visakhapatnamensis]